MLTNLRHSLMIIVLSCASWALSFAQASEKSQNLSSRKSKSSCVNKLDLVVFSPDRLALIQDLSLRAQIENLQHQRDQRLSESPQETSSSSSDPLKGIKGLLVKDENPNKDLETRLFRGLVDKADSNEGSARKYIENDKFTVIKVHGSEIPEKLLDHIGAHREVAYRAVGEGSGTSNDKNDFDFVYDHIILVAKENGFLRFAGQYRQVPLSPAIRSGALDTIASNALLRYDSVKLAGLPSVIELGRSMLVSDYSGHTNLKLLWNGLAHYLLEHTDVLYLTGLVSVSSELSLLSRTLLYHFYMNEFPDEASGLGDAIDPEHKFEPLFPITDPYMDSLLNHIQKESNSARKVKVLNRMIEEIEGHGEINPLLAMYPLFMNVKYIAAVIDPEFGSTDFFISIHLPTLDVGRAKIMGDPALLKEVKESREEN